MFQLLRGEALMVIAAMSTGMSLCFYLESSPPVIQIVSVALRIDIAEASQASLMIATPTWRKDANL